MVLAAGVLAASPPRALAADADVVADGDALLASRNLAIPVEGVISAALRDTFSDDRGGHRHEAIDIVAPRGAKVFAVDDGRLVKLFASDPGGLTVYQFDPQRRLAYYYAHLDRYADGLREGMTLRRCDLLGYLGTTGNAAPGSPHLHFAVFRLGPARQWWRGTPLNPYPALTGTAFKGSTPKESAPGGRTGIPLAQAPPLQGGNICR
jgi:murein DD-endopeptidase MepM/ murein hydrolase activator NlpD